METIETTRHEAQVDERLAEIWGRSNAIGSSLESIRLSLAGVAGIRGHYEGRKRVVPGTLDENLAAAREKAQPWDASRVTEYAEKIDALRAEREALRREASPMEVEYETTGWSRFFLVNNTGGHIHSSMSCSTCRFDTSFSWLPALSGLTEKDAVAEHGAILCTVCFPSAPVEWTNGHEVAAEAKKAARCPGSGQDAEAPWRKYQRCNHCGETISVTEQGYGRLRAHKAKETS